MKIRKLELADNELSILRRVAGIFRKEITVIMSGWEAMQDTSAEHFPAIKQGIAKLTLNLTDFVFAGDIDRYLRETALLGKEIIRLDLPYDAFMDAFHSYEDSYLSLLKDHFANGDFLPALSALHKLHHRTICILAEEYFTIKDATIFAMARLAESRDGETGRHLERVRDYTECLCRGMDCDDEFTDLVQETCPLHDIGKVAIPDTILKKPGKLTKEEFEIIKTHASIGAQTLDDIIGTHRITRGNLVMARDIARYHHEKFDGSGYNGIKGDAIPLAARIFTICDIYDALTSDRPYRPALSHDRAVRIITQGDGRTKPTDFDPRVLKTFLNSRDMFDKIRQHDADTVKSTKPSKLNFT